MNGSILIIEDDPDIAELQKDYFEAEGLSAEISPRGDEGLEKALEGTFDCIILDLMLPGTDGYTIAREVRKHLDIPILMVSARQEEVDKIRGLGLGADDYITKPFSPSELTARVKMNLKRYRQLTQGKDAPAPVQEENISFGTLKMDVRSTRCYVRKKEVFLTHKEFRILLLLLENPDRSFTREDIYSRIWGDDTFGDITTVTVHIRKIREKIEEDPNNPEFIETVWGIGYRMKQPEL